MIPLPNVSLRFPNLPLGFPMNPFGFPSYSPCPWDIPGYRQVKRHDGIAASAGLTSSLQKAEEPERLGIREFGKVGWFFERGNSWGVNSLTNQQRNIDDSH